MKKLGSLILMVLFLGALFALPVAPNLAETAAQNAYLERGGSDLSIRHITDGPEISGTIAWRWYRFEDGGFVLLSADDRVYPLLGYSVDNDVQLDNLPPQLQWMLGEYRTQIEIVLDRNLTPDTDVQSEWNRLAVSSAAFEPQSPTRDVAPLITTTWNQGYPYNYVCPTDSEAAGEPLNGHVWAGCVATAMAQIMNYWQHPVQGTGSFSYEHSDYGTQSANFGNTTYNWSNLFSNYTYGGFYTSNQLNTIGTLLYHCGVSVSMDYGVDASGAYSADAASALVNYFGYSSSISVDMPMYHTDVEWATILRNELDNGRPVGYRGESTEDGGHAWVLDGYQGTNHFHMNWGWSGASDGYFYLNDLTPDVYDFNSSQGAILGIEPAPNESYNPPVYLDGYLDSSLDVVLNWVPPQGQDEALIWDQIDPETETSGKSAQDFGSGYDSYDSEVSADFVLTEETTLTRSRFHVFLNDTISDPLSFNVAIYPNNGTPPTNYPGETALYSTTTTAAPIDNNDIFEVVFDSPITLSAGTYWIGWQVVLDYGIYGAQGYAHLKTTNVNNSPGWWRNPGDGFGSGYTTWTQDCLADDEVTPLDVCYQLYGTTGTRNIASNPAPRMSLEDIAPAKTINGVRDVMTAPRTVTSFSQYRTRLSRDLTGFKVYRNSFEVANITDPSTCTWTDVQPAQDDYEYYVTAIYNSTNESIPSNTVNITATEWPQDNLIKHYESTSGPTCLPHTSYNIPSYWSGFVPPAPGTLDALRFNLCPSQGTGTAGDLEMGIWTARPSDGGTEIGTLSFETDAMTTDGSYDFDMSSLEYTFGTGETFWVKIVFTGDTTSDRLWFYRGNPGLWDNLSYFEYSGSYTYWWTSGGEYMDETNLAAVVTWDASYHDISLDTIYFHNFFLPTETRASEAYSAELTNMGTYDETGVNVVLTITDEYGSTVFTDTQTANLLIDETVTVNFATWNESTPGVYTLTVENQLANDSTPDNDIITLEQIIVEYPAELAYDDGDANSAWVKNNAGNGFANKFTPPYVPYKITDVSYNIWPDSWPSPGGNEMMIRVVDDDGTNGTPGTVLYEQTVNVVRGQWNTFDLSAENLELEDGSFYVAYVTTQVGTDSPGLSVDTDGPFASALVGWDLLDGTWSNVMPNGDYAQEFMIRASVDALALDSPQNPGIVIDENDVQLNWDTVNGANSYNVLAGTDPQVIDQQVATNIAGTSWTDTNAAGNAMKYYTIVASSTAPVTRTTDGRVMISRKVQPVKDTNASEVR